jgi:hypothetical protein
MAAVKLNATLACVFTHLCGHLVVTVIVGRRRRVVRSRIPEPETEVSYRVVALGVLKTVNRILQAVFGNAVVETSATHYACRNSNDLLQSARSVHDC